MNLDINIKLEEYDRSNLGTGPKQGHKNRSFYKRLDKKSKREYKMKWEKSQRRRNDRYKKIVFEDSDYLSDTSNGTVTSKVAFGYPNDEIDDHTEIEPEVREPYRPGYYLLLSYENGGWTYPEVKRYFWQKHGVRCFRSKTINDTLKGRDNFKALVKFRNRKALNDVCKILAKERM